MKHLMCAWALMVLASAPAIAGDILTIQAFDNRDIWAFGELWIETLDDYFVNENHDEPLDEDPWVSGVVGEQYHAHGESIAVADQNSRVDDGPTQASFHAQGFASGASTSGGINVSDFVESWTEGTSDVQLRFRVEVPVDFVLSGTIWSSGVGQEAYGHSEGVAWVDAFPFQTFAYRVEAVSNQLPFQTTGTLQPGVTYTIRCGASADAQCDFDIDLNVGHHYYAAGGYDIDLVLTPSVSAVGDEFGDAFSVLAYPNPSSGRTRLLYAAPRGTPGTVEIFDLRGRLIRRWDDVPASSGPLDWDGRGPDGRPAAAGTYFVRARSGPEEVRRKLVLMR